jgi:prolyl oligopeptidase
MPSDNRPTPAAPDDDPYLWLEDIDGARATAWAEAQTEKTRTAFLTPSALADRDMLAALLDRPDKLAMIGRRGPYAACGDARRSPISAQHRRPGT